ncbi:RNA polymerase-binding protein DksA [Marinivivus vitaminiproducens]|nr:RNA polymerase-binding protein DksA [Geminicoccaceae bacterium SCSIO 64248]
MNDRHLEYFKAKLLAWRDDILKGSNQTLQQLREEENRIADLSDWATAEIERSYQLRARDRERKLLSKIEAALKRIDDGTYGFCEETFEPIGLKRLDARPIATLSIEAQERHERREKIYREE